MHKLTRELLQWMRSGLAGAMATAVDLGVLALLVSGFGVSAHMANVPALVIGGIANFIGNRHFAFRARGGSLTHQAIGYTAVEIVALVLNGVLYEVALRVVPGGAHLYWLVRIVTSHLVFLCWSYPLWRRVFRVRATPVAA